MASPAAASYVASIQPIHAQHQDLIHDVAFDFYGTRMATCSSDQTVRIWDQRVTEAGGSNCTGSGGEWTCTASWKSHSGSVWKLAWAHPEFGQVLATCSFDRSAAVWEELPSPDGTRTRWLQRASLVDSRTSVTDIQFAPKHLGLQLATCSQDGIVHIYEAQDVMNLAQWSSNEAFSVRMACSSLAWNPSRVHPPMLALGSDDPNTSLGGKVFIYEYSDRRQKWQKVNVIMTITEPVQSLAFAPNSGRPYHVLAIASKDVRIITLKPLSSPALSGGGGTFELRQAAEFSEHKGERVWRVEWDVSGTVLSSTGDDGVVRLWKANYLNNWKCIGHLKGVDQAVLGAQQISGIPQMTVAT